MLLYVGGMGEDQLLRTAIPVQLRRRMATQKLTSINNIISKAIMPYYSRESETERCGTGIVSQWEELLCAKFYLRLTSYYPILSLFYQFWKQWRGCRGDEG
jgi:hypothetical protein